MHYSRIPSVLETSKDPDTLSNRVVHMSVQLFSNESLALKMVEELSLLHVMVISLKMMMTKNLIENTLHGMHTTRDDDDINCSVFGCFFFFKQKFTNFRFIQKFPLCHRLLKTGYEGPLLLATGIRFQ